MDLVNEDNDGIYNGFPGLGLVRAWERMRFWLQSNSRTQAPKNISYHYDLGNDFYRLWLDDTMTYSSALFRTGQESLETAQIQKYEAMVDGIGAEPGDHVLEIGCGWGGFAEYAARERGLKVTGLTISREQRDYAEERIRRAGLSDRVEIKLQDYRDEKGTYDGIASIEMFEAVGEKYWPVYFERLNACLKPGRMATLQIITVREERWESYRKALISYRNSSFQGGFFQPLRVLRDHVSRAGLEIAQELRVRGQLQPDAPPLARGLQCPMGRYPGAGV